MRISKFLLIGGVLWLMAGQGMAYGAAGAAGGAAAAAVVISANNHEAANASEMTALSSSMQANAFFILDMRGDFALKDKNGIYIGACLDNGGLLEGGKNCHSFQELAKYNGCTMTGITALPYNSEVIVYCKKD